MLLGSYPSKDTLCMVQTHTPVTVLYPMQNLRILKNQEKQRQGIKVGRQIS